MVLLTSLNLLSGTQGKKFEKGCNILLIIHELGKSHIDVNVGVIVYSGWCKVGPGGASKDPVIKRPCLLRIIRRIKPK